jgi:hypothetical protein
LGLPKALQNLVILAFALQTNRSFFLHGGPTQPTVENLPDDLELREQRLPSQSDWEEARQRASSIFGVASSPLLNASNVSKLVGDIRNEIAGRKEACEQLVIRLNQLHSQLGAGGTTSVRLTTAQMTKSLVDALAQSQDETFVAVLARAGISSTQQSMGTSFKKAAEVVGSLSHVNWELLEAILKLTDERQTAAQAIWNSLKQAFQADELAVSIDAALVDAQSRAVKLLADIQRPARPGISAPLKPTSDLPSVSTVPVTPPISYPGDLRNIYSHLGSDEAEVATFYQGNAAALERNRKLVEQLKKLYDTSQVSGDSLPGNLPTEKVRSVLEVHLIQPLSRGGDDARSNMIVVSPTLHLLIHLDENCMVDLGKQEMVLFGVRIKLHVQSEHNG